MKIVKRPNEKLFKCGCGCEFYANDKEFNVTSRPATVIDMLLTGNNQLNAVVEYNAMCPWCFEDVKSL